jgi:hypothetical protein
MKNLFKGYYRKIISVVLVITILSTIAPLNASAQSQVNPTKTDIKKHDYTPTPFTQKDSEKKIIGEVVENIK